MKANIKSLLLKTSLLLLGVAAAHAGNFTVLHSFGSSNKITGGFPNAMLTQSPQGTLYGIDGPGTTLHYDGTRYSTIQQADANVYGTIFAVNPDGTGFQTLHIFTNVLDGSNAVGGMVLVGDTLYGTTYGGGAHYGGTVFRINTNSSGFTHLYDFGSVTNDGLFPSGTLVHSNGILYGTTFEGGQYGLGTVFSINVAGGSPSYLVTFNGTNGGEPRAGLTLSSNTLFGCGRIGGIYKVNLNGSGFSIVVPGVDAFSPLFLTNNLLYGADNNPAGTGGRIFSLTADGLAFSTIHTFPSTTNRNSNGRYTNSDGYTPVCVVVVSNQIYGVADNGGTNGYGTLFSVNTNGSDFTVLKTFEPSAGYTSGTMILGDRIYGTLTPGGLGYGFLFSLNLDGSGYTNFFNFAGSDGSQPVGELLITNGLLYGATRFGGAGGYGMIYQLSTNGGFTNLYSFNGINTSMPNGGLVLISNTIYGSTSSGWNGKCVLFGLNMDGSGFTNIHSFSSSDFTTPFVTAGGRLFGYSQYAQYPTGYSIGTNGQILGNFGPGQGAVSPLAVFGDVVYGSMSVFSSFFFSINPSTFAVTSYPFPSGFNPSAAAPLLVGDTFYGTSLNGGAFSNGCVYSVGINGSNFTILHNFSGPDGQRPSAPLLLVNGALYGTTPRGGSYDQGNIFSVNTDGTGFAVHHTFTGGADGYGPTTGLHLSGNTLYGSSPAGGDRGMGLIFSIPAAPVLTSQISGGNFILSWISTNYSLQSAFASGGNYTAIPGATSPYTNALSGSQLYFRLISN